MQVLNRSKLAPLALLLGGALFFAGSLIADSADTKEGHKPQKTIDHPLAKKLVGSWTTQMSGAMSGTGTATFALGVGDTVLMQDEAGTHKALDGNEYKGAGHGMYRFSDDGATVTAWWIDNAAPGVTELTGKATPTGFEIAGTPPGHKESLRIVLEASDSGFSVRAFMGAAKDPLWTQTYASTIGPVSSR
jgi:hypothetical protein